MNIPSLFQDKTVLITGHTGFKGSWLTLWLHKLGAIVHGFSLPPDTEPDNYTASHIHDILKSECLADIRDRNGKQERWFQTYEKFRDEFETFQEFLDWYNKIRPHMSLKWDIMETPEMAFYRKAVDLIRGNCVAMFARELEET